MHISHIGQASVPTHTSKQLCLTNILHVPSVAHDLLSVHKFTWDNNVFCEFHPFDLFVKDRDTRDVLLRGRCRHGLYELDAPSSTPQVFSGVRRHSGTLALVIRRLPLFAMFSIAMSFQSSLVVKVIQFVMPVKRARVISFLFLSLVM
jgi:hypothetical protein